MPWPEFWWIIGAFLAGAWVNTFAATLWKRRRDMADAWKELRALRTEARKPKPDGSR